MQRKFLLNLTWSNLIERVNNKSLKLNGEVKYGKQTIGLKRRTGGFYLSCNEYHAYPSFILNKLITNFMSFFYPEKFSHSSCFGPLYSVVLADVQQ